MKNYENLYIKLNMDIERHQALMEALGSLYREFFLSRKNIPPVDELLR